MITNPWLERWLPLLRERAGTDVVLEIGCGHGDDTAILASAGLSVFAFDLSHTAVGVTSVRVPSATVQCRDIREPFPEQVCEVGAIVASLSLHYFAWDETQTIVQRIHSTLRPGGIMLCRLNSTQDHNFGASGHAELEPNLFLVEGNPKRFFDKVSVELLFGEGWNKLSMEHYVTSKYVKPKALWEIILERSDA